jgi:hypothetical protein
MPSDAEKPVGRGEDVPEVRILLRVFLGIFGGLFLGVVAVVTLWSSTESRPTPDGLVFALVLLFAAPAVGFAAFARNPLLRVLAWGAGGAGFGDVLLAVLVGGLSVGDYLTPMGIVLALVGSIIGYRTVPPGLKGDPPSTSNNAVNPSGGSGRS